VPVFAILGGVSISLLLTDLRAGRSDDASAAGRDPGMGAALALVAALGAAAAVVLSLLGAVRFDMEPAPLLRSTLLATVPLAVVVAALGLFVGRTSTPAAWPEWLRFPLEAVLVAGVSAASIAASHLGFPSVPSELWWRMEHLGAFGMGVAVALILVHDPWRRAIVALPLAVAATYTISIQTAGVIGACLVGAITLWWVLRLGSLALPLFAGSRPTASRQPSR
jgi:hypothetical protein